MKIFITLLLLSTQIMAAQNIFRDEKGFVVCAETQGKTYFLNWDKLERSQNTSVFYFEKNDYENATGHHLRGCQDFRYIKNDEGMALNQILLTASDRTDLFNEETIFSIQQIEQGGKTFRSQKTVLEFILQNKSLFALNSITQIEYLKNEYGAAFASEAIKTWIPQVISKSGSCDRFIGSCDFYLCQEQKNECGLDGYNLGFGFKYCTKSKFELFDAMKTSLGKSWVTNVFQCLQQASQQKSILSILNNDVRSCEQIKLDAFDSHPDCYVDSGFCSLKFSEKLNIFKLIKKEIFKSETLQQGRKLLHLCHLEKVEKEQLDLVLNSEFNDETNTKDAP